MSKHSVQLEAGRVVTGGPQEARRLRKYDGETRAQAVALSREVGEYEAARRMGICPGTLWGWIHRGQGTSQRSQALAASVSVTPQVQATAASVSVTPRGRAPAASVPVTPRGRATAASVANCGSPQTESAAGGVGKAKQDPKRTVGEKKVAVAYTPSQRVQALEYAQQHGVTQAAAEFGMSRFSIQEWRRKVKRSAVVKTVRNPLVESGEPTCDEKEGRVVSEWGKHKGLGPSQIRNQLRRAGLKVSVHFVRRVMEEHGYVSPKVKRSEPHDRRYEAVRPNYLWHADFMHRYVNKQKTYVLLIIDDFSRFVVGAGVWEGERVDAVIKTFEAAVARHGRPEAMMSDGGSAFYAWRGVAPATTARWKCT